MLGAHPLIFAVLTVWTFAPLVVLLIYAASHGGELTGASGTDAFDQLAYLAWIRDEGSHLLASNLWQVTPTPTITCTRCSSCRGCCGGWG